MGPLVVMNLLTDSAACLGLELIVLVVWSSALLFQSHCLCVYIGLAFARDRTCKLGAVCKVICHCVFGSCCVTHGSPKINNYRFRDNMIKSAY